MPTEIATFMGYGKEGDETVARFYDRVMREEFSLTKKLCEERLGNLKKEKCLHDQTDAALRAWPEK